MPEPHNIETTQPAFLQSLFKHVTDSILVVDESGYVADANPAAEKMTGYNKEELIGKVHFCEICRGMATCTEENTCVNCFAKRASVSSFEMRIRTKDGREIPVTASSSRLPADAFGAMVIIIRDISEQQRTERERFQRLLTNYVIHAQEEERKRVARDLHDGVGQALYSILVGLKVVNQLELDDVIKQHLEDVHQMTARTLEEVKKLAVELRPSALDDLGLVPAIRSYTKRFQYTFGIETELKVTGRQRRYASAVETALYRICQEAMTNAAKYADTDMITVELTDSGDCIELVVTDQGLGFDLSDIKVKGTGLGLYGMKERATLVGGELHIHSVPGDGTSVTVTIPVDDKGESLHVDTDTGRR